jgi:hypothetical protein
MAASADFSIGHPRSAWYCWEGVTKADIQDDIAAYEVLQPDLEAKHMGKWVVIHDRELAGIYDAFESAAEEAVRQLGRGPYLIRQVGAPPVTLPASVMFNRRHS